MVSLTRFLGNIDPTTGLPIGFSFQPCVANEMTGRWHGFYNSGKVENVPITIDLRQEPFTLETPNGVYSVMSFSLNSDRVTIEAVAQTGMGNLRLEGTFDKGVLSFQFGEERENSSRFGKGSAQRLYIAQWAVAPAAIDTPYNHPLLALTPATGALNWSIAGGNLPAGIALDGLSGVLSGTTTVEGTFDFTVEVRDANGDSYKQPLTLNVSKLVVNPLFLPQAIPNREYRFNIEVSGGAPPYTFSDLSFPFPLPGLPPMPKISLEGQISFTPEYTGGAASFEVADSRGLKQFVTIPIRTRKLLIEGSAYLPSGGAGQSFNFEFKAAGQQGAVVWEADPEVLQATGLSLDGETGKLSGTAPDRGVYSFWVTASDDAGSMTRQFTLTVTDTPTAQPGPGISSLSRTNASFGVPGLIPTFSVAGLVNGSSFAGPPPAGASIASLFGSNLASGSHKASTLPLSTTLGGTTVHLNNIPAPLFSVSPGQVSFQVPVELIGRTAVTMTVTAGGVTSAPVSVSLSPFAPGIFTTNSQGTGQGAVVLANTVIVAAPEGSIPGRATQPARRGGVITIFCTGLGDVTSRPASGAAATGNPLAHTLATPIVTIGGASASVISSGLVPGFVGLYQINVQLPTTAPVGPAVPVSVSIGGAVANAVTIAVQ